VAVAKASPEPAPVLTALPAYTVRDKIGELSGSMALTALFAGLATALWAALSRMRDFGDIGTLFFLTVATCWAILVPAKFWTSRRGDSWARRIVMMLFGVAVGIGALWVDGKVGMPNDSGAVAANGPNTNLAAMLPSNENVPVASGYIAFFALAFFALRW